MDYKILNFVIFCVGSVADALKMSANFRARRVPFAPPSGLWQWHVSHTAVLGLHILGEDSQRTSRMPHVRQQF